MVNLFFQRLALCVLTLCVATAGCDGGKSAQSPQTAGETQNAGLFEDVTIARGLPAPTQGWPDGTFATPEVTEGGVAVFDYDNDGRLDIYQVCHAPPGRLGEPVASRLFHQQADGTFREVPNAGGANNMADGMGAAVGDYNNDGLPDLYVTNYGQNHLYRNNGDGAFTDVTQAAGLINKDPAHPLWSTSATWVDYDGDGWLDLYVVHFATYEPARQCFDADGKREYCGPNQFTGLVDSLYHNNRDGTFTEVSAAAGINYPGRGWGVACADLSGHGGPDIFVSNDEERQNLWVNQHDGTFKDEALERGVAFSGAGNAEAGMGVAIGDVMNDGRLSLLITHITNEKNTLYMPFGPPTDVSYADKSASAGTAALDLPFTGWGVGFIDFDNSGNLGIAIVNGRVAHGPPNPKADVKRIGAFWSQYAQTNRLLRGDGHGHFTEMSDRAGDFAAHAEVTRALAFGDFDNDGRVDLLTNGHDNTLHLYRNMAPAGDNHWLMVRALTGKRDALGARLELVGGGRTWTRLVLAGYSFCSSNDPRAHFGLGPINQLDSLRVTWPDGKREIFRPPGVDRQWTIRQGEGQPPMP